MPSKTNKETSIVRFRLYGVIIAVIWTAMITFSALWNAAQIEINTTKHARIQARTTLEKDIIYRRWNAQRGGLYAPITENTPPNPYLSNVPERDLVTPSGKSLTLINPAYMTRQAHELAEKEFGTLGHITSLNPIRPENAADDWEQNALKKFEIGEPEVSSVEIIDDKEYLRLMGPLLTEESCLKCHAAQGYKVGDIRGGISVAIPMTPLRSIARQQESRLIMGHLAILLLGLIGIIVFNRKLWKEETARVEAETKREKVISELQEALRQIKTLKGLIPICASCKKIRDDKGFWSNVEVYIRDRTDAEFSHGICPDCAEKLYGDF
ncbi:MAG: DUF3365 domain-containing protein [FCB group bacterium]|nr:DUF3365 domain-containing protein [FCB group bacterium]